MEQQEFLYENLNNDQIAKKLLEIAEEKLLIKIVVNKYKNNQFYATIFNEDEVTSELYNTVFSVMKALERYNLNKKYISKRDLLISKLTSSEKNKLYKLSITKPLKNKISKILKMKVSEITDEELEKIVKSTNEDLKLDNESHITGYLIAAFTNNISKIYGKYKTGKRGFTQMIYIDSHDDSNELAIKKNKLDSIGSIEPIKEKDYNKLMVDMALYLKKYDKKQNQINQNDNSKLAKLFCSIVNPKKVEDNIELRNRFGWSQYLLNKNKENLIKKLKEEFNDCKEEVFQYFDYRDQQRKAS